MAIVINLKNDINNASVQIGDIAYYVDSSSLTEVNGIVSTTSSATGSDPIKIGKITDMSKKSITIENEITTPSSDAFIMFQKDRNVNNNSLLGYYAEVKLSNNSTEKAELFALSSEITASSK